MEGGGEENKTQRITGNAIHDLHLDERIFNLS